ncbi:glycosyltransferase family 4 protein [Zooshikella marina]|uniref:glycosyltransferase family 4 protein n=1 Tax=Zooshikella ganghwensis TaxID=202772 RepID=UPI001BB0D1A5|nr:glycosyltransferase family 4 protein [Zooshikella ganghwensis]MBU2704606.1 glycosyltransferase family 4 protein [Zooshikella ganghwensis]
MKVIYFHQHFSTPKGATGIRSYEMSKSLLMDGHEVTVVCGSYGAASTGLTGDFSKGRREGIVDGIKIVEFDLSYSNEDGFMKRTFLFIKYSYKSISIVFKENYDIVFATSTPLTAAIPGIFARWFRGKKFVFEVRDLWPELPRAMGVISNPIVLSLMSFLEWLSYKSAHKCIGLSPGIIEGIIKRGKLSSDVELVPNGCDLDIFNNNIKPWRPKEVSVDDLVAIYTGTHGIANGLDALINVANELKKRKRDDIKIILVGQGKLKRILQEKASDLNLNNILFYDSLDKFTLSGLMAGADVGMQILANVPAFYYGTSPNKFFDYIAAGLPVLTNYPGWIADMIIKNKCGFNVPPDDAVAFADVLESAAADKQNLKNMGNNARMLAEKSFDRNKLAEKWKKNVIFSQNI